MLLGKKETFAVEYVLDENYGGIWMYGKICYWINNRQIGNYELGASLRDILFSMNYIVHDCGNRVGSILCDYSPEEIFFNLNESIYGDIDNVFIEVPEMPVRFNVCILDQVFKHWRIFLYDCNNFSYILYKKHMEKSVRFFRMQRGEFDFTIKQSYTELDLIYESIRKSEPPAGSDGW